MSYALALVKYPGTIVLCTTEARYEAFVKATGTSPHGCTSWIGEEALGHAHYFDSSVAVCVEPSRFKTGFAVAETLCHEAVHVFQHCRVTIGEDQPSSEFEAYGIQAIFADLMRQYLDQVIVL